jgi:hypothetical protein
MAAKLRPAVQLAVAPAARACRVGEPVAVRVTATGVGNDSIREARARLVMKVWLRKPQVVAGQWGAAPPSAAPQRTIGGTDTKLRLYGDLPAGSRAECDAALPNWAKAPSGGQPPGRRIEYFARAELSLASGRTVRAEAPVLLVSGPGLYQQVEGAHRMRRARRCDIDLVGPAWRARPGESVRGTVRVVPHRPMRVRSVVLEMIRTQTVPKRVRVMWARTLARDIEMGSAQEFEFQAPVPVEAPTMITQYLSVHWHLRAVVRYGLLAADRLDTEINVYTGKP